MEYNDFRELFEIRIQALHQAVNFLHDQIKTRRSLEEEGPEQGGTTTEKEDEKPSKKRKKKT
jgi:hypothetical protein